MPKMLETCALFTMPEFCSDSRTHGFDFSIMKSNTTCKPMSVTERSILNGTET